MSNNMPRREMYDCGEHGWAIFVPNCPRCGRFVRADKTVKVNGLGEISRMPNATCKKDGRVTMPFEGWF